jgi:hypothetical protein
MAKYLLSTYSVEGEAGAPATDAEAKASWDELSKVEEHMKETGTWFFSGRLHDPGTATVVRPTQGGSLTTDGPFVEGKEHVAGFYIIEAPDLDAALGWAAQVTACIGKAIEVRPFAGTAH